MADPNIFVCLRCGNVTASVSPLARYCSRSCKRKAQYGRDRAAGKPIPKRKPTVPKLPTHRMTLLPGVERAVAAVEQRTERTGDH